MNNFFRFFSMVILSFSFSSHIYGSDLFQKEKDAANTYQIYLNSIAKSSYQFTHTLCSESTFSNFHLKIKKSLALFSNSLKTTFFFSSKNPKATTNPEILIHEIFVIHPFFEQLVHSPGFYDALGKCFGNNLLKTQAFITAVYGADYLGRVLAIWLHLKGTAKILGQGLGVMFSKSFPATTSFLIKLQQKYHLGTGIQLAGVIAGLSYISFNIFQSIQADRQARDKIKKSFFEDAEEEDENNPLSHLTEDEKIDLFLLQFMVENILEKNKRNLIPQLQKKWEEINREIIPADLKRSINHILASEDEH